MSSEAIDFEALRAHPFVQEWSRKATASVERGELLAPRVQTPADIIGEKLGLAVAYAAGLGMLAESDPALRLWVAHRLAEAIPFWWPNELDPIIKGLPLPKHVVAPQLPAPVMWLSFEGMHNGVDGILLTQEPEGIRCVLIGDLPTGFQQSGIRYGKRYPEDIRAGSMEEAVLKFLAFIASPYTETQKRKPSRADRRMLSAELREEPEVHVVVLRAAAKEAQERYDAESDREYRHRWWVRGHFRAQWYPSIEAHKVVWIAPYVKGPDDKPFKAPVYVVTR